MMCKVEILTASPLKGGRVIAKGQFATAHLARAFARAKEKENGVKPFTYWLRLIPIH